MISIQIFMHNHLEYGIDTIIDGSDLNFLYIPSNDKMKFFIPAFCEEYEQISEMLTSHNVKDERITEFIRQFEIVKRMCVY